MLKLKPDTKYQMGVIAGCNRLFAEAYDVKMPTGQERKSIVPENSLRFCFP